MERIESTPIVRASPLLLALCAIVCGAVFSAACGGGDGSGGDLVGVKPGTGGGGGKDAGGGGGGGEKDAGSGDTPDGGEQAVTCTLTPPSDGCGLAPQCGCNANETCDITNVVNGAVSCVKAGTKSLGRACMVTSECLQGFTCQFGSCRPFCAKVGASCNSAGTGVCIAATDDQNVPMPNDLVCTLTCDPVSPEALCGTGNTCLWFPSLYAPAKVTDCSFPGDVVALAACTTDYDCVAGYACGKHPTKGLQCEKWCRIGAAYTADCPSGFTCKDVYGVDAPVLGGIKEGLCQN